jgi:hypothetical protein
MAQDVRITCINKSDRLNPHERIQSIGGVNFDNTRWKLSLAAAIEGVESGRWRFWVHVSGESVWVVVATSAYGHKYLKTVADGFQPDNLLSLPECP